MRESIQVGLSKRFADEVIKPEIQHDFDYAMDDEIQLNIAYAAMLVDRKIIDKATAKTIIDGLKYVQQNMKREDCKGELEDIYFNVERQMFAKVGSAVGGRLHTGRSRNDIGATLARMQIRNSVFEIMDMVIELQKMLLKKAAANTETVITGYTHFQPGQPITLGHYYMAFYNALTRDFRRILNAYACVNICPYGAAAFAGSSFPIDRQMLSDLLGFDSVMENTLDCIASRDYFVELLAAYAAMSINISRIAEDMDIWATFENGMLDVGGEIAICSSIMPQKKNPVTLEMARAKAGHVIAGLSGTMTILKGDPFTNNMDIYEIPVQYFNAAEQLKQQLVCMIETVTYCSIRKERAYKNASDNLCTVTNLADYMVKKTGISFTNAHDIVGNIVSIVVDNGKLISGITPELLKAESEKVLGKPIELTAEEINSVLDPFNNLQTKVDIGGPSVSSVKAMIANGKKSLAEESAKVRELRAHITKAYAALDKKVEAIGK